MSPRDNGNSMRGSIPSSEIVLYQTEDGRNRIEVRLEHEAVWLTINQMAELFQVDKSGISRHLKNVYDTGELQREATVAKYATVQEEGGRSVSRDLEYYNLDAGEIDTLNRIVVMFVDQAEFRAQRRQDVKMGDWTAFLDKCLRDTELPVLQGSGTVSQEDARAWAEAQYDRFAKRRRMQTEEVAEKQYLENLQSSAKMLEASRKKPSSRKRPTSKKKGKSS